jgi:nucleoside-diphosphate-sugar epimerase
MELQADAMCRRFPNLRVASMRPHWVLIASDFYRLIAMEELDSAKQLWGWTEVGACAQAFLLAITKDSETWKAGHEAFLIVSPRVGSNSQTTDLVKEWWPKVPCRKQFRGQEGLFDCSKAKRILGWEHQVGGELSGGSVGNP